ncbi:hypothetical protein CR513_17637, partial [Mucuna pruriens]
MAKRREAELRQQIAMMKATEKGGPDLREIPIPPNFREIVIESYDGTQDPHTHLQAFQTQMYISSGNDRLSYKLFSGTLRCVAMHWMATLPAKSIQTFSDLASSFVSQFAANKVKRLEVSNLFDIKQAREENLKSYLACFNNATIRGLRAGPFSDALALRKPASMKEIHACVEKHVQVEEDQLERRKAERALSHKDSKRPTPAKEDKR